MVCFASNTKGPGFGGPGAQAAAAQDNISLPTCQELDEW